MAMTLNLLQFQYPAAIFIVASFQSAVNLMDAELE